MGKHTSGPWNVDFPPEGGVVVCEEEGAVLLRFEDYDEDRIDEDALLVAAAPKAAAERDRLKELNAEMLEALKAMASAATSEFVPVNVIRDAQKVIAKAEGGD